MSIVDGIEQDDMVAKVRKLQDDYASGDFICYVYVETGNIYGDVLKWFISENPAFSAIHLKRKLIHKKHSHIAEEVSKNSETVVGSLFNGVQTWQHKGNDFFESYNRNSDYELDIKPPDEALRCKRIKVTLENRHGIEKAIKSQGHKINNKFQKPYYAYQWLCWSMNEDCFTYDAEDSSNYKVCDLMYLSHGKLVDYTPIEEQAGDCNQLHEDARNAIDDLAKESSEENIFKAKALVDKLYYRSKKNT